MYSKYLGKINRGIPRNFNGETLHNCRSQETDILLEFNLKKKIDGKQCVYVFLLSTYSFFFFAHTFSFCLYVFFLTTYTLCLSISGTSISERGRGF